MKETIVARWFDCLPQYLSDNRHARIMDAFWKQANQMERTLFAGKFFGEGVGVPDCIISGIRAVESISIY